LFEFINEEEEEEGKKHFCTFISGQGRVS